MQTDWHFQELPNYMHEEGGHLVSFPDPQVVHTATKPFILASFKIWNRSGNEGAFFSFHSGDSLRVWKQD